MESSLYISRIKYFGLKNCEIRDSIYYIQGEYGTELIYS